MKYAGMRAASNVLLRDVNTSLIIEEMYRGANVIYCDFTDYDELAHHCGPERVESLQALDGVDAAIANLAKAAEDAPRPYRFVGAVRPRAEPWRDIQTALRPEPGRGRPRPHERAGKGIPAENGRRRLDLRELLPVGDHPQQRDRTDRRASRPC